MERTDRQLKGKSFRKSTFTFIRRSRGKRQFVTDILETWMICIGISVEAAWDVSNVWEMILIWNIHISIHKLFRCWGNFFWGRMTSFTSFVIANQYDNIVQGTLWWQVVLKYAIVKLHRNKWECSKWGGLSERGSLGDEIDFWLRCRNHSLNPNPQIVT